MSATLAMNDAVKMSPFVPSYLARQLAAAPADRARFATSSRLVASLVNEALVAAQMFPDAAALYDESLKAAHAAAMPSPPSSAASSPRVNLVSLSPAAAARGPGPVAPQNYTTHFPNLVDLFCWVALRPAVPAAAAAAAAADVTKPLDLEILSAPTAFPASLGHLPPFVPHAGTVVFIAQLPAWAHGSKFFAERRLPSLDPEDIVYPFYVASKDAAAWTPATCPVELWQSHLKFWIGLNDETNARLVDELSSSVQIQTEIFDDRIPYPEKRESPAIDYEVGIIEGHPTHPMHRTRLPAKGFPKLPATMDLHNPIIKLATLPKDVARENGNMHARLAQIPVATPIPFAEVEARGRVIVPIHELQAPYLQAHFADKLPFEMLDHPGIPCKAQTSLRTVVPIPVDGKPSPYHIKVAISVQTTSATRTISPFSVHNGVRVGKILHELADLNALTISDEIASVGANVGIEAIDKCLSCVLREDPEAKLPANERTMVVASLIEREHDGSRTINRIFNLDTYEKRVKFFEKYARMYLKAFLPMVYKYGFALEAHLQNSLLRADIETGEILGFVVRDFGGVSIHVPTLLKARPDLAKFTDFLPESAILAEDMPTVRKLADHAMFQNNLHRVIRSLGLHRGSAPGWAIVRRTITDLFRDEPEQLAHWIENDTIGWKCFISMRMEGLYRDYIYNQVPSLIRYGASDEDIERLMDSISLSE